MPTIRALDVKHGSTVLQVVKEQSKKKGSGNFVVVANETGRRPRRTAKQPRRKPVSTGRITQIAAPVAFGQRITSLGIGLRDQPLDFSYVAGYVKSGDGTTSGAVNTLYFMPAQNGSTAATTFLCARDVPILPGDITLISPGSGFGFGSTFVNNMMRNFRRIRFDAIQLDYIPYGTGVATNTPIAVALCPLRGSSDGADTYQVTNSSSPYYTAVSATLPANATTFVMVGNGAIQTPVWAPASINMTPFIAGGSGPKQNEFPVAVASATAIVPFDCTPCAFRVGGAYSANVAYDNAFFGTVIVRVRAMLMDFAAQNTASNIIGADVKAPPPLRIDDLKSSYAAAFGRRVADAPSPTQSLLGAELHATHLASESARPASAVMPIPVKSSLRTK